MADHEIIGWHNYFMEVAMLSAERSKHGKLQVGACIVAKEDKIIIGTGYNGLPRKCLDNAFPRDAGEGLENIELYYVPAEVNAVVNANTTRVKESTMYVTRFPNNEGARIIIQAGIKCVIYKVDDDVNVYMQSDEVQAAIKMLRAAEIDVMKYDMMHGNISAIDLR